MVLSGEVIHHLMIILLMEEFEELQGLLYFVASGVFTVFGIGFPIVKGTKYHDFLFNEMENLGYGKWGTGTDPIEIAQMMIAHIDKKRRQLGIDKARERTLVDMSDRRQLTA